VDWQRIRLQEQLSDSFDSGRVPRTVECELTEDLVGSCVPGDIVTVTGVVKIITVEAAAGKEREGGGRREGERERGERKTEKRR
jgi:DNA helicase MCM8